MTKSPITLEAYLKDSGIRRKDFAETIGISNNYLTELLSGRRVPTLDLSVRIQRITKNAILPNYWVDPGSPSDIRSRSQIATSEPKSKETADDRP